LKVDDKPVTEPFKFLIGLSWVGDMQLEIIQPVYGPTIYEAFIEKHGEGRHHIEERIQMNQRTQSCRSIAIKASAFCRQDSSTSIFIII
jgi:methylmalonyl-CoA/ethylmalonyl-CoA epimerase